MLDAETEEAVERIVTGLEHIGGQLTLMNEKLENLFDALTKEVVVNEEEHPAPAPATLTPPLEFPDLCGDPSPHTANVTCTLVKGHDGMHHSTVPNWGWERSKL